MEEEETCFKCFQELIIRNWSFVKGVSVFILGIYVAKKAAKIASNVTIKY